MSAISQLRQQPPTEASPFRLFQAINAFQLTEAIRSAIELDIFTAIGAGHTTERRWRAIAVIAELRRADSVRFFGSERIPQ